MAFRDRGDSASSGYAWRFTSASESHRSEPLIDLCESCGMCCNGTLYTYVTIVESDRPNLDKYPQLKLKTRSEQETFDEPCVLHTGNGCSAYDDRPATCSQYLCKVLRMVRDNEVTEEEALLIIKEGRALVENVLEYVEFEPGLPIAVSTWDGPPEGTEEEAKLAWERTVRHLGKYFLGTVREEVVPSSELPPSTAFVDPTEPERPRGREVKRTSKVRANRALEEGTSRAGGTAPSGNGQ